MTPVTLRIKQLRQARGLSQAALAKQVGVRQATINDLENGHSGRIELGLIDRLSVELGVQPGDLFAQTTARRRHR